MHKQNLQVVVFMTTWCPHCKTMKEHTWANDSVKKAILPYHNSKPAFLLCDKPQNRHLVDEFAIERYPTVVIIDEDHNIRKKANNMSPDELVNFLDKTDE
jgi:thiol-disulfide isomerase/thioredoxin|tara:strand:+ start:458 stop:757 length:300 start_codon:yes stop_codon:yes gene_type:complete